MAVLEAGEATLAFGSGMAAISGTLLALVRAGDHILYGDAIYGSTYALLNDLLPRLGIEATPVNACNLGDVTAAIRPNTRAMLIETPANPTMKVVDIAALAGITRARGIALVCDNTFASPALQLPLTLGADVVVHSATKFIGGHGDVIAGIAVGARPLIHEMRPTTLKDLGGVISPFDAWLLLRGLKTLDVRMQCHSRPARVAAGCAGRARRSGSALIWSLSD